MHSQSHKTQDAREHRVRYRLQHLKQHHVSILFVGRRDGIRIRLGSRRCGWCRGRSCSMRNWRGGTIGASGRCRSSHRIQPANQHISRVAAVKRCVSGKEKSQQPRDESIHASDSCAWEPKCKDSEANHKHQSQSEHRKLTDRGKRSVCRRSRANDWKSIAVVQLVRGRPPSVAYAPDHAKENASMPCHN